MRLVRWSPARALAFLARSRISQKIVDLALHGADFGLRIDESGGADDLLDDDSGGFSEFVGTGSGGNVNGLIDAMLELLEFERAIV